MNTRKLTTLGLALALTLGTAGAYAAQPATQPTPGNGIAPPMEGNPPATAERPTAEIGTPKMGTAKSAHSKSAHGKINHGKIAHGKTRTSKVGTSNGGSDKMAAAKAGTRTDAAKLNSGRSVAAPATTARKATNLRQRMSQLKLKRSHRVHLARVAKKSAAKHA